jgi:FkbM family methyltransferase
LPERRIVPDDHVASIEHFLAALPFTPSGVVHVGAHEGQEVAAYLRAGCQRIVLVEANPEHCATLRRRFAAVPEVRVLEYAVSDAGGRAELRLHASRSGDTQSSSLLPLKRFADAGTLRAAGTVAVTAVTLDELFARHALDPAVHELLVLDVQGAEAAVLRGAAATLPRLRAVLCEVELVELYEGAALEDEIVAALAAAGFACVDRLYYELADARGGREAAWGDALFVTGRR